MVEPDALLIVEACSRLAAFRDVELLHEFLQREQLLLCAWVPSKQGKEVYYCLREISALTETIAHVAGLGVVPFQREHRESEAVAIALAQFSLAVWFQQQRQVGEAWHCVFPSERTVQ